MLTAEFKAERQERIEKVRGILESLPADEYAALVDMDASQRRAEILDTLPAALGRQASAVAAGEGDLTEELFAVLFDPAYSDFSADMPYGTQKARTGDPYQWITAALMICAG